MKIYIEQPKTFYNNNYDHVLCLCKSFYGLKQFAYLWFDLFMKKILVLGFYWS